MFYQPVLAPQFFSDNEKLRFVVIFAAAPYYLCTWASKELSFEGFEIEGSDVLCYCLVYEISFEKDVPDHICFQIESSLAVMFCEVSPGLIEMGEIKSFYIFNYEC